MKIAYSYGYDDKESVVLEATCQNIIIPIYYPKTGQYLCCNWYTYERIGGAGGLNKIDGPQVYFCNGEYAIFCNDITKARFECLGGYGKDLVYMYLKEMEGRRYTNDFSYFTFWKTEDETDEDVTQIIWKLGPKNHYKSCDGGKTLIITTDGTQSRSKLLVKWLVKHFTVRCESYVDVCSNSLRLNDKIEEFVFDDPKFERSRFEVKSGYYDPHELIMQIGVKGTNYYTGRKTLYETASYDTDVKSTIKYSQQVFLMSAYYRKILFIHELVHTKIGGCHGHDEYFWHLFERYSRLPRTEDFAYSSKEEAHDTNWYNERFEPSCAILIKRNNATDKMKW